MKRTMTILVVALLALFPTMLMGVRILNPIGPSVLAIAGLLNDPEIGGDPVEINFWRNFDEVVSSIVTGRADVLIIPASIGANLYNQGMPVRLLGINLWRTFSMVSRTETDGERFSLEDLKGKEVFLAQGRGQTSDVVFRFLLQQEGINPETELMIRYLSPSEIVPLMNAGTVRWALLPEPFVTLALNVVQGSSLVFSLEDLWGKALDVESRLPITGIYVTESFWSTHPEKVALVREALAHSAQWLIEEPDQAIEVSAQYLGNLPIPVLHRSLQRSLYEFMGADEIEEEVLSFFRILHEIDPQSVSKVPGEGFFAK